MKKIYNVGVSLCMALVALVMVGCNIDDAYDLSNLNTDNIGIGTDDTTFDMPLMEVSFDVEDLLNEGYDDESRADGEATVADEVDEADEEVTISATDLLNEIQSFVAFLPSSYEDGIEIDQLSDEKHAGEIVDALLGELTADEEKRDDFCLFVYESQEDYPAVVATLTNIITTVELSNTEAFADALGVLLNDSSKTAEIAEIRGSVTDAIVDSAADFDTTFQIDEEFADSIEIDDAAMDLIESNLDGVKNTLSLLFSINSNLPIGMTIEPKIVLSDDTQIAITNIEDLEAELESISAETLRSLLSKFRISVEITFTTFIPDNGDLDLSDKYLSVKFIARKSGSIKL